MIRIPNSIDRYIQDSKLSSRLEKESRKLTKIFPAEKGANFSKQNKNETLFTNELADDSFSDVLSDKIKKKEKYSKKV